MSKKPEMTFKKIDSDLLLLYDEDRLRVSPTKCGTEIS